MPATCPLPPQPTKERARKTAFPELTEELQAEKPLPFSVPSTVRCNTSLTTLDIYRLALLQQSYFSSMLHLQPVNNANAVFAQLQKPNHDFSWQFHC